MFRYIMEFHISLIDELINRLYYHGSFLHLFFLFSTGPYHHIIACPSEEAVTKVSANFFVVSTVG